VGHPLELPDLNVPQLLKQHGIRPDKRLGQNFLIDAIHLIRVVEAGEISAGDIVLEIGAGLGSLTRLLAQRAREVVAVELDEDLIPILKNVTQPAPNVRIIQGDILALEPANLVPSAGYLVAANIPYYITSKLIRHLLGANMPPKRIVLTVQKEVAQRICASPGELSLLGLSVQVYGDPRIISRIPAGAFYPVPKVDSAIVRIDINPSPKIKSEQLDLFFRLAKAGFSQKRKTLRNSLSAGLAADRQKTENLLQDAGIDPSRRAQTLSLEEWGALVESFNASNFNNPG
jgi:16S rRNA (adenine1518-N6/adenine1519-N6)-dimethyltransferase